MNTFTVYLSLFLVVFLAWCGLTLYVIFDRLHYDRQTRSLGKVLARLGTSQPVMLNAKARSDIVHPLMARLPLPVIDRVAANMTMHAPVAEVFAEHAVARWGLASLFAIASERRPGFNRWQRISALCILSQAKAECIYDLLLDALQDKDPDVASTAIVLLGRLQDARAAEVLVLALRMNWHLPSFIARQLDTFRIPIDDLLAPLLESADPQVRYWAVMLLARGRGGTDRGVQIARLAGDPDPAIRKAVVQALGMLGASREALVVLRLLYDDVPFVRIHAAKALASFNRPDFAGSLAAMLSDPEWRVRLAAKEALHSLEQPALGAAHFDGAGGLGMAVPGRADDRYVPISAKTNEQMGSRMHPGPNRRHS